VPNLGPAYGFWSEIYGYRELEIWIMTHNLSKFIEILSITLWRKFRKKVPGLALPRVFLKNPNIGISLSGFQGFIDFHYSINFITYKNY